MRRITLETPMLALEVVPELGAGVAEFSMRGPGGAWAPLWRRSRAEPGHFNELACYLLAPWSNRVPGGVFSWAGREYRLERNWPDGTAIHGAVASLPWTVHHRSPVAAVLAFDSADHEAVNWPWRFGCQVRYELDEGPGALRVGLSLTNLDDEPMPAGLGFHPFCSRTLWATHEEAVVRVGVTGRYPARGQIPTGPAVDDGVSRALREGTTLSQPDLDDVFAGFEGRASIRYPESGVEVRYECSPELGHAVVYNPRPPSVPGPCFCLEPVTMVNDGLGALARGEAGTGVRVLAPGDTLSVRWVVSVHGA